jgi:hypothetical protein
MGEYFEFTRPENFRWILPIFLWISAWSHLTVRKTRKYGSTVCPRGEGNWFYDSQIVSAKFSIEGKNVFRSFFFLYLLYASFEIWHRLLVFIFVPFHIFYTVSEMSLFKCAPMVYVPYVGQEKYPRFCRQTSETFTCIYFFPVFLW